MATDSIWQQVPSRSRKGARITKDTSVFAKIKQDALQSARRRELRSAYDFEVIWSSLKEDISAIREFIKETDFPDHLMGHLLNFRGKQELVPLHVEPVRLNPLESMNFPALGEQQVHEQVHEHEPVHESGGEADNTWSQVLQAPQPIPETPPPPQTHPTGLYMLPMDDRETFLATLRSWELRDLLVHPPLAVKGGSGLSLGEDCEDGGEDDYEYENDGYEDFEYTGDFGYGEDDESGENDESAYMRDNPDGLGSLGHSTAFAYKTHSAELRC